MGLFFSDFLQIEPATVVFAKGFGTGKDCGVFIVFNVPGDFTATLGA